MKFNFGLYSSLLLIFFFNGMVYTVLTLRAGAIHKRTAGFWLGSLLFLLCLYFTPFMLGYAGWYAEDGYREVLFYTPFQQLLLIGPFFFFYVRSLLYPSWTFSGKDWLHLAPGILYLLYSIIIWIADVWVLSDIYFYRDGQDKDFDTWYQIAGFLSMCAYFSLGLRLYRSYQKKIFQHLSYAGEVTYRWVQVFLIGFLALLILRLLFFAINPEWGEFGRKYWYYQSIAVLTYLLAIEGYKQIILSAGFSFYEFIPASIDMPLIDMPAPGAKSTDDSEASNHHTWFNQVENLMREQRLYENPVLTLADIAGRLNTTTRNISVAINRGAGLNFNDFVNRLRVESVVREFESGSSRHMTLLGIALSCGFNSKSTFNRAFRKFKDMSPREYIEKIGSGGVES
jgi:AraC-like DNA-binding protein